jgi:hypothetical protein
MISAYACAYAKALFNYNLLQAINFASAKRESKRELTCKRIETVHRLSNV